MDSFIVDIYNIVGSENCIEADEGQKVFNVIKKALDSGKQISISFQNIDILTTAFLNTAIGQMYRDYEEDFVKRNVSVVNIKPNDITKLKRVNSTAKAFYKNPEAMRQRIKDILGED